MTIIAKDVKIETIMAEWRTFTETGLFSTYKHYLNILMATAVNHASKDSDIRQITLAQGEIRMIEKLRAVFDSPDKLIELIKAKEA
jgi:hypothetical protein